MVTAVLSNLSEGDLEELPLIPGHRTPLRICFIGDSFVSGIGDDACLGWTGRLCSSARQAGQNLTSYNLGIQRNTSTDIKARWQNEVRVRLSDKHDNRLVFSFGANDCTSGESPELQRVPHELAVSNAEAILSTACTWRPTLFISPLPVSDDSGIDSRIARLNIELSNISTKLGIPYLDVFSLALASQIWQQEAAAGDGTHPNAGGYAWLADVVATSDIWQSWLLSS
jgi:acyl-CoA thioesterase I